MKTVHSPVFCLAGVSQDSRSPGAALTIMLFVFFIYHTHRHVVTLNILHIYLKDQRKW